MTNKKEHHRCPNCPQTTSREWNLKVHISRKHPDLNASVHPIYQKRSPPSKRYDQQMNLDYDSPKGQQGQGSQQRWQHPNGAYNTSPVFPEAIPELRTTVETMIKQNEDKIGEQMLKQNERERDKVHETFEICLRAMIINQMEKRGGNGGDNPLNLMSSLISTGIVILVQTVDAVGNTSFRYELRKTANTLPLMHTSKNGYDNPAVAESLKKIAENLDKRNEIIMKYIEVSERKKNIKRAESLRRLDDVFHPPQTNDIESRRQLKPEDRRLNIHHDILERREERDKSRYKWEHELKQKGNPGI